MGVLGVLSNRLHHRHRPAATLRPDGFYPWIEVYLGDRWYAFDPRNNAPRIGRILTLTAGMLPVCR